MHSLARSVVPDASTGVHVLDIRGRRVLNSHVDWANEFVVELSDGSSGRGSSPRGQTPSAREAAVPHNAEFSELGPLLNSLSSHPGPCDQTRFDALLEARRDVLRPGDRYALSLAFLNATCARTGMRPFEMLLATYGSDGRSGGGLPRLLFNVLNGGRHAYTNPVLSDFTEFLLVPKNDGLDEQLAGHREVQREVRDRLAALPVESVAGNPVHRGSVVDNRVWIDLLLETLHRSGWDHAFGIMIDASAGDLMTGDQYHLSVTGAGALSPAALLEYWHGLLSEFPVLILEDPFAEHEEAPWRALTRAHPDRMIASDNLSSTDPRRVAEVAAGGLASAVLIKPDQAGTITATVQSVRAAEDAGIPHIPSHRSIETGDTFLSDLCHAFRSPYAKLGLLSDFETVLKLNALLRYTGES